MAKKCIWLITLVPLLAFQTMPASACNIVGYKNGEPLCGTTSDGAGQPYTDARPHRYSRRGQDFLRRR
jgi:hypothetical protein